MSATFVTLVLSTTPPTVSSAKKEEHTESRLFSPLIIPLSVVYCCWLVLALLSGSPRYVFDSVSKTNWKSSNRLLHTDIFRYQVIQYVLLLPTRINIVNLYAFCNIHDVSWGTKGNDRAYPLPSVSRFGNVSVGIPGDAEDELENMYGQAQQLLKTKDNAAHQSFPGDDIDITFKQFRTLIVAAWALGNGLLVFLILNYIGGPVNIRKGMKFITFVLWSFACLTGIKSTGALYYFVTERNWGGDGGKRNKKQKKI
jgi:chitin synthase